jgi:hypothetical protein
MNWSITGQKQFNICQRQWYYGNIVADARVKKDAYRRELTILSKLQTIEAWRGSLVDDVISRLLVNAINNGYPIKKDYFLKEAYRLFDLQMAYALDKKYRLDGARLSNDQEDFAALFECELGNGVTVDQFEMAKSDVTNAISNLVDEREFIEYLKSAGHLASQRPLIYSFDRFSVLAKPDLIAFFQDSPPHIFDWKVHTFGMNTYDEQLISYALALYKVAQTKPHTDFPENLSKYSIYDYRLTEYQLLHPDRIRRDYQVTGDRIEELGSEMASGLIEMYVTGCFKNYKHAEERNFSTTVLVEQCPKCPFQRICKPDPSYELRDEHFQD